MTRLPLPRTGITLLAAAVLTACGHSEQVVVDKYFQAVNAKDNQTIGSFALVSFDKKVERWKITASSPENREKAPLPDLIKTQKDIEAQIADNKKKANAYFLDNMNEVDEYRDLKKSGGKVPAKLATVAADWDKYEQREKELRGKLAEARRAVEREKKNMMVSVGTVDEVEGLEGELLTKTLDLDLTIEGQPQPYKMLLKKYEVKPAQGAGKVISRWVVAGLQKP